jgi:3-hydroxyacyl-[acyl-carrier-protein] dehydratase
MSVLAYDAQSIETLLPHRYPFLLVDRIEVVEPGRHVRGTKRITSGEWWMGMEPRGPIPFTLVLEALAQTSGALVPDLAGGGAAAIAYFMGADRVRFRQPSHAGDELVLDVTLKVWRRGVCRTLGVATVDGSVVVSAELTTIVRTTA